jgi:hypothetical protein
MKRPVFAAACLAALAACGQAGELRSGSGASQEACALIAAPQAIFGDGFEQSGYGRLRTMAASCEFQSADARRSGEVIIATPASLGRVTAEANMADIVAMWDGQTETPLAALDGLGEEARIASDLPGYQTQIVFRQNGNVVMVMGSSGDEAMSGEEIARRLAHAASQALAAAP